MPLFFAITLFVSASLLFLVQPMIGKMILPLLGGTPSVWNTCMVFFQATLLAGYSYAHFIRTHLSIRRQVVVHSLVLLLPVLVSAASLCSTGDTMVLPIRVKGWVPPSAESYPVGWLLALLVVCAGLPFFAVATTAPLLQDWFAKSRHQTAEDPYYLYAASNAGSLTALLSYPLLFEPNFRLADQSWIWFAGFGALLALIGVCGMIVWRFGDSEPVKKIETKTSREVPSPSGSPNGSATGTPSQWTRLRWIALALVPSSLMLGVTTYITTDVAPIPLLWIIPLSLYLLSFVFVFSRLGPLLQVVMVPLLPLLILGLLAVWYYGIPLDLREAIALHLVAFFVATMVCHGELARTRPATGHLTEYYLWMALGGVLGGMLNSLVAPVAFNRIVEYPLVIALACLLRPHWPLKAALRSGPAKGKAAVSLSKPEGRETRALSDRPTARPKPRKQRAAANPAKRGALIFWSPELTTACWCLFGVAAGVGFLLPPAITSSQVEKLSKRNFFGVVQVRDPEDTPFIQFYHGTTLHGLQSRSPDPVERNVARSYFHEKGPIGQVFTAFKRPDSKRKFEKIGVVGLGIGSLAAYVDGTQDITFYEIDPNVELVARDTNYFTFLSDCEERLRKANMGKELKVILGDGRLQLEKSSDRYDLLVLDAFSSDSVPVHLLTQQALQIYRDHLTDHGILAFNISSKYLRLAPVLGDLAGALDLVSFLQLDSGFSDSEIDPKEVRQAIEQAKRTGTLSPEWMQKMMDAERRNYEELRKTGRLASQWVIMARSEDDLRALVQDHRWKRLSPSSGDTVWSDDYSNLLSVFVWDEQAEAKGKLEAIMEEESRNESGKIAPRGAK
jgi:hypothetical protein